MGNLIFPFRKRGKLRQKIYLGHGYWIYRYDEAPEELVYIKAPHTISLGKIKKFDNKGFPKLEWQRKPRFLFLDELNLGDLEDVTETDTDETE